MIPFAIVPSQSFRGKAKSDFVGGSKVLPLINLKEQRRDTISLGGISWFLTSFVGVQEMPFDSDALRSVFVIVNVG